ncbi:MAG: sensor domain-containing protein [Desulfitobacteriaceae bacterium]
MKLWYLSQTKHRRIPAKISQISPFSINLIYAVFGILWILLSDPLVHFFVTDRRTVKIVEMFKGWFYVLVSAGLLHALIKKGMQAIRQSEKRLQENFQELEATHEELLATQKELKQQFIVVREQEEHYRRIFESVSSGVLIQSPSGPLIMANQSAKKLLGLSFAQITGKKPIATDEWQAICEDGSPFHWEELPYNLSLLDNNARLLTKIQVIPSERKPRWLNCYTDPIINPATGALEEIVTTLEDITEQKLLEEHEDNIKRQLEQSQERYLDILENMSNAVAVYEVINDGEDFIFKEFNSAAERLEHISRAEVLGHSIRKVFPQSADFGVLPIFRRVWQTGEPEHFPTKFYEDGRISGWRDTYLYRLSSGELVTIYRDVTARKQAEEALWLEKERAQVTLQSIGDAVITTDIYGIIEYINPVAEDLTGWTLANAKGEALTKVFQIISELTEVQVENPVVKCLAEGRIVGLANHTVLIHRDGHHFAIEDSAAPIQDRQGAIIGAVLVFHDVSYKRNLLREMTHQAHHDALTGLPNRLLFNDRLNQAITQAHRNLRKVAVLFLDLDRFKLVNDTLGHAVGDRLLQAVSERLKNILREGDTIGRQGGDEFIIILPEISSANEPGSVAQKILTVFSAPFALDNEEVFVTPSIGISIYPTDGQDIETLIKHADTAMYHAKESGRNNYQFFTVTLNVSAQVRLELESNLRRALEREEFVIYYQPVFSLQHDKIMGVEALVRWNHPRRGLIPPDQFIYIAEDTGLIVPLGEWVLRTACAQVRSWEKAGFSPLRVAVNISARQFRQSNLTEAINNILTETTLPPPRLELEITESIAAQDVNFTIDLLQQLKATGIRISIDDFGTGFSSLSYLRRFPIDTLKIDKSFVGDIQPLHGHEIVTSIIDLAQNLKFKVIAEGVETEEQLAFLKQKGCDEIQGYLFCKPLPSDELEQLLTKNFKSGGEKLNL